jgi:hypothetical protein
MHGQARDDPHKADGDFSLLEQHFEVQTKPVC